MVCSIIIAVNHQERNMLWGEHLLAWQKWCRHAHCTVCDTLSSQSQLSGSHAVPSGLCIFFLCALICFVSRESSFNIPWWKKPLRNTVANSWVGGTCCLLKALFTTRNHVASPPNQCIIFWRTRDNSKPQFFSSAASTFSNPNPKTNHHHAQQHLFGVKKWVEFLRPVVNRVRINVLFLKIFLPFPMNLAMVTWGHSSCNHSHCSKNCAVPFVLGCWLMPHGFKCVWKSDKVKLALAGCVAEVTALWVINWFLHQLVSSIIIAVNHPQRNFAVQQWGQWTMFCKLQAINLQILQ